MSKRKAIEDKVIKFFKILDPSNVNADYYSKLFKSMSDSQFMNFFKEMASDENNNFYLEVNYFENNKLDFGNIVKAADFLKCPLEEYVYVNHKHLDGDGKPKTVRSLHKVPVIYLHLKRMQQILAKKVRMHTDIMGGGVRNKLTGALNNSERTGRFTDMDLVAVSSIVNQLEKKDSAIVKEMLGPRSDNMHEKFQLEQQINLYGDAKINDVIPNTVKDSQAVNTVDVFLLGAGIKSDLVTNDELMTRQGMKETMKSNK